MLNLKVGDCLLYTGKSLLSRIIRIKTWSRFSHAEVYIGDGKAITSRETGTKYYEFTRDNLTCVLRPNSSLDVEAGKRWFDTVVGQRYDTFGLLRFFTIGEQSKEKQFCSEAVTRFYRAAGFNPFAERIDADLVSPGMLFTSPNLITVWDILDKGNATIEA